MVRGTKYQKKRHDRAGDKAYDRPTEDTWGRHWLATRVNLNKPYWPETTGGQIVPGCVQSVPTLKEAKQ